MDEAFFGGKKEGKRGRGYSSFRKHEGSFFGMKFEESSRITNPCTV